MKRFFPVIVASLLSASLLAEEEVASSSLAVAGPQPGDCVVFREGGAGLLLRTPIYWLRGSVVGVMRERRLAAACPRIAKSATALSPADHARLAAAMPCVDEGVEPREVDVLRVRLAVVEWETPWSPQQGTTGWLFRGRFLDQTLEKGKEIDMDARWLQRCAGSP